MDVKDIEHLAVERIFLIPDSSEGVRGYLWCDDPAPGMGMDPSEAVEYVRKDVHEAIIAKQAKAAISGMDAAKAVASSNMEHAKRLHAECNPQTLDSERSANALLTERIAELEEREAARTNERDTAAMRLASTRGRLDGALAHIDRIIEARNSNRGDTLANICAVIDEATHQTSLARRDALNKAEGMDWVLAQSCNEENEGIMWRNKIVEPEIQRLRQQAQQC